MPLDWKRMNCIVFVQYNPRLRNTFLMGQEKGIVYDPISLYEMEFTRERLIVGPHLETADDAGNDFTFTW